MPLFSEGRAEVVATSVVPMAIYGALSTNIATTRATRHRNWDVPRAIIRARGSLARTTRHIIIALRPLLFPALLSDCLKTVARGLAPRKAATIWPAVHHDAHTDVIFIACFGCNFAQQLNLPPRTFQRVSDLRVTL